MRKTFATFQTVVKTTGDAPEITISTRALDRDGDILEPSGADFSHYLKNPVVLFGHDHYALPIGRTTSLKIEGDSIQASFAWLENDPDAARVRNAFDQRVLNAASVGFLPMDYEPMKDSYGRRYTKWQLLEWSLVPVPSNPEAVRTLKSLGLAMPSRKRLDTTSEADALDALLLNLKAWRRKSGRVLSAANEQSIRDAIAALESVLAKLDADEDGKDFITLDDELSDEQVAKSLKDLGDDIPDELVADALASMLPKVLKEMLVAEVNKITGRIE